MYNYDIGTDVQKSGAANSGVSVSWLAADNQALIYFNKIFIVKAF